MVTLRTVCHMLDGVPYSRQQALTPVSFSEGVCSDSSNGIGQRTYKAKLDAQDVSLEFLRKSSQTWDSRHEAIRMRQLAGAPSPAAHMLASLAGCPQLQALTVAYRDLRRRCQATSGLQVQTRPLLSAQLWRHPIMLQHCQTVYLRTYHICEPLLSETSSHRAS